MHPLSQSDAKKIIYTSKALVTSSVSVEDFFTVLRQLIQLQFQFNTGNMEERHFAQEAAVEGDRLLAGVFSSQDFINNAPFCQKLGKLFGCGNEEDATQFHAYLKEEIDGAGLSRTPSKWTNSSLFLLFLAWCLCYARHDSPLEAFLIDTLFWRIHSLSLEQKQFLHSPLKESLQKLPLSTDEKSRLITTEREGLIVFLFLQAVNMSTVPKPEPPPPDLPPLAEDPYPSLIKAFQLALALVSFCRSQKASEEENEEDRKKKKEELFQGAEQLLQQLSSRLRHILTLFPPCLLLCLHISLLHLPYPLLTCPSLPSFPQPAHFSSLPPPPSTTTPLPPQP